MYVVKDVIHTEVQVIQDRVIPLERAGFLWDTGHFMGWGGDTGEGAGDLQQLHFELHQEGTRTSLAVLSLLCAVVVCVPVLLKWADET